MNARIVVSNSLISAFLVVIASVALLAACATPSEESNVDTGDAAVHDSAESSDGLTSLPAESLQEEESDATQDVAGLANPASVYCVESGGRLEIVTDDDGAQFGMCYFSDGSYCEEWAFFRGDCAHAEEATAFAPDSQYVYRDDVHGFTMEPADQWRVEGQENQVVFRNGDYFLFVGVKGIDQELEPFRTGMPAGEFVDGENAMLLGQELPTRKLVYGDKTKVVEFAPGVIAGDLQLFMWLDAEGVAIPYDDVDFPADVLDDANQMIATFAFTSGEMPELELP